MVSAEVAVAATDQTSKAAPLAALLSAAAALPLLSQPVQAGQIEEAKAGVTLFSWQEKDQRMQVRAPVGWVQAPLARDVDIEASVTLDGLSGASPRYVSNQSGKPVHALSSPSIRENRREGLVKLTRWMGEGANDAVSVSAATSSENDYLSQTVAADGRFNFLNQNVTLALGASLTRDHISSSLDADLHERRITRGLFAGITQLLGPDDILQSNLAFSSGHGYFNDPYKYTLTFTGRRPSTHLDQRPDNRNSVAWLTRWRHYLAPWKAALGVDYRYYQDDWGIRSHMIDTSWHQPVNERWAIRPGFRYTTQSAADFYGTTFTSTTGLGSSDSRLAAFGAVTLSLTAVAKLGEDHTLEIGAGRYAQRASWRPGGGSADLPRFDANFLMLGWQMKF
jgi:hypothetical protein